MNDTFAGTTLFLTTFGSGSSQFSSATPADFNFSTAHIQVYSSFPNDGRFGFVNSIPYLPAWHNGSIDHTPNDTGGYMLLVNSGSSGTEMYRRTFTNLCVGLRYEFSLYVANLVGSWATNVAAPNLQFSVLRTGINQTVLFVFRTGLLDFFSSMTWIRYSFSLIVPVSSIILSFTSTSPAGSGNDVVIDDILFGGCTNDGNVTCP